MRRMGVEPRRMTENLSDDVDSMLRAVSEAGYESLVKYVPYNWSDDRSPEQMADYLSRRYFEGPNRENIYSRALAAVKDLSGSDSRIHDAVNTTVAWIYWKTQAK